VPADRQDTSVRDAIDAAVADGQRLREEIEGRINARFASDSGPADTRRAARSTRRRR
jgi:hypothetical protein